MTFGGRYPPAYAQLAVQRVPVLTVEDAVQDNNINALNVHLTNTDTTVKQQWETINSLEGDMRAMQGEERGIGVVLGLISGTGLILQVRKKAS